MASKKIKFDFTHRILKETKNNFLMFEWEIILKFFYFKYLDSPLLSHDSQEIEIFCIVEPKITNNRKYVSYILQLNVYL